MSRRRFRPTSPSRFLGLLLVLPLAPMPVAAQGKEAKPKPIEMPKPEAVRGMPPAVAAPTVAAPAGAREKPKAPTAAKPGASKPESGKPEAGKPAVKPAPKPDASVAFFKEGVIPRLKIEIAPPELEKLRQQNREYVRCTVTENDQTRYESVGIHLKGAAGSFRGLEDKPALTLNFDKFKDDQKFHDLDKLHLNNSVQDPSYLNELLCSELFLAAGVPAARVTHARVWLNGRDLGFFVLKEGFNKNFLKRHFANANGNFYEGPFVSDLDGPVELQNGDGPADRSDVKAVVQACREGNSAKRWEQLEKLVDIDQFLRFMALELMTCHWDGYCNNRNNYRFYFEPKSGAKEAAAGTPAAPAKLQFFPHGMDQMFGDSNFSVLNTPGSMVSQAVLSNPEWRGRYRDRLAELQKLMVPADRLLKRVDEVHQRIRPVVAEMRGNAANELDGQVREVKNRLTARAKSLLQQNAVVEPRPLTFGAAGSVTVAKWEPRVETADAKLMQVDGTTGKVYTIVAGPAGRCVASWRSKVILPAGKYRFEAKVCTKGLKAMEDSSGVGAGIRVSGSGRTNRLDGNANWTVLTHEFEVQAATQEVELVAEVRATSGQAWFDASSLKLSKVPAR